MTNVVVGRLDDNQRIQVPEGTSVLSALNLGGYTSAEGEVIQDVSGDEYDGGDVVEEGGSYYLVSRVKNGCDE